ncbi:MAG: sigma-70 family RNA polymerase sigma factor [Proteobacteria bacterium]|nr:sigma-70 family RNA polymerase sigma factor [Pseudomonadota bacterium]
MKVCSRLVELDEIFRRRSKHLYILALSITLDRSSAEDCVHDALVSVAELQQNIDELEPYLFRVVRNKAVHRIKQIQKDDNSNQIKEYLATRSDSNETERLISQIKQHIECLDGNHQQVLLMKLFSGLTFEEIGRIIESSPNTVASWYRRGLEQLKEKIHENR